MKPKQEAGPSPVSLRRAIANLLRFADIDLRDARMLTRRGSLRNAVVLIRSAMDQLIGAILVSEQGSEGQQIAGGVDRISDDNPFKARLSTLAASIPRPPTVRADGSSSKPPNGSSLSKKLERVAALLAEFSKHFGVGFANESPARTADPIRPAPPPPLKAQPKLRPPPVAAQAAAKKPGGSRPAQRQVAEPQTTRPEEHKVPRMEDTAPVAVARSDVAKPTKAVVSSESQSRLSRPGRVQEPTPAASRKVSGASGVGRGPADARPIVARHRPDASLTSTFFWSLMDRWKVADLDALALIGHAGGRTKKGTRPRFKLSDAENDMVVHLRDVDDALSAAGLDSANWLREPISGTPFSGTYPLDFVTQNRVSGARQLSRYILQQGLRLSLKG